MAKVEKVIDPEDTRTDNDRKFDAMFDAGITVTCASLHQVVTLPGAPVEKTLSDTKIKGILMSWTPAGLLCKIRGKRYTIPAANVASSVHS